MNRGELEKRKPCRDVGMWLCLAIASCLVMGVVHAKAVQVNTVVSWDADDVDGWQLEDAAAPAGESGDRTDTLVFHEGSIGWSPEASDSPNAVRFWLEADIHASAGAFVGDYFDHGVYRLAFDFYAHAPATLEVELRRASDLILFGANVELEAGWQRIELPLLPAHFSPLPFSAPVPFRDLLTDIDQLAFGVRPGTELDGQVFRIRNVLLQGSDAGYADWIADFEAGHGGSAETWLPAADRSENDVINAHTHIAGLHPADPDDLLRLVVENSDPIGVHWISREDRVYSLWQSSCLNTEDFTLVTEIGYISGTGSELHAEMPPGPISHGAFFRLHVERATPQNGDP